MTVAAPILSVVALSVGTPERHIIHGHETLTSIVRTPFDGPITVDPQHGIADHRSAIHDAHVYAFFAHHYDFWTSRLGIERAAWDWCHWGENLTVAASTPLDETAVFVGDIWEFHADHAFPDPPVILRVEGTRVPCSRLAWRCGQKSDWLADVSRTGLCGMYLRVLQGGQILTGHKARIIPYQGNIKVPVSSIPYCMTAPVSEPATRELALQILQHPDLQNMNRQHITRKLSMIEDQSIAGRDAWKGWRQLRISRVVRESSDVKSFYLQTLDDAPLASFVPGQFLPIRLLSGLVRCWSISSWAGSAPVPTFYRITVRKGPNTSQWLHDSAQENMTLDVRCPAGSFTLDLKPQYPPRQIYISAGIGITALLPMLQAHFGHETFRRTPAIWIRVVRNGAALETLSRDIPQTEYTKDFLKSITFFTQPRERIDVLGQDYDYAGKPTQSSIVALLRDPYFLDPMRITPIQIPGSVGTAYICGPPSFDKNIRSFLLLAKVSEPSIRSESFSVQVTPLQLSHSVPENAVVHFTKSKKEIVWEEGTRSILELAVNAGLKPEFGCRLGSCGSCEVRLRKGKVGSWSSQEENEKWTDVVRICSAVPTSSLVELDF